MKQLQPIVSRLAGYVRLQLAIREFVVRLRKQNAVMEAAWEASDFRKIAKLAHWLKGAAGTLGFNAFTEPAIELEQFAMARQEAAVREMLDQIHTLIAAVQLPEDVGPVSQTDG